MKEAIPPWEATYAAWPGVGTICGTLMQAQTGCPAVDGTSYRLEPEQEGMLEQHTLGDNTVLAAFGVVPSAEGITIIGSTLW